MKTIVRLILLNNMSSDMYNHLRLQTSSVQLGFSPTPATKTLLNKLWWMLPEEANLVSHVCTHGYLLSQQESSLYSAIHLEVHTTRYSTCQNWNEG